MTYVGSVGPCPLREVEVMRVAEETAVVSETGLVERIVGESSILDVIAADEERRRARDAASGPDGTGLVAGMLLGGVSWAVIVASVWLIVR